MPREEDQHFAQPGEHPNLASQRRYLFNMATVKALCPNCATPLDRYDASNDRFSITGNYPDDGYECPSCKRGLVYYIELIGGSQGWFLKPIDLSGVSDAD